MIKDYSVLMSVYCKENPVWFEESIKSIMAQTITPKEFVLVEDGPLPEELETVVQKYLKMYSSIFNVVKIEKNGGLGPALRLGVEKCTNELIVRMDSDDYSVPNRVEKQLEVLENKPDVGIVGSNVLEFIDSIDNVISEVVLPEKNEEIIKYSKKRNPFRHPSIMFKKSEVMRAGNYREYYLFEDYDMWVRMIRNGSVCYNIQENLVYMRISKDFYKRRGGWKYMKSILRFKNEQLKIGYFSFGDYIGSTIPHIIVCLLPNGMRDWIYRNLLRKKKKNG